MANDLKNLAIGGHTLNVGDWVTAAGTVTYADVGILKEGSEISPEIENYAPEFESLDGSPISIPVKTSFTIKAVLAEATLDNLLICLAQPAANLTGSAPNKTLLLGIRSEMYKAVKIVGKGNLGATGTRAVRTITAYRCAVEKMDALTITRSKEQLYVVTFRVLQDTTVATADQFIKIVDSGGA